MSFRIKDKKGYFLVEYYISNLFKGSSGYTVNIQNGWKALTGGIGIYILKNDIVIYEGITVLGIVAVVGFIGDFLLSGLEITYVENV